MNKSENTITNLYNLFEAVFDEVDTEDENIVPSVVMHLIDTGKVKLVCKDTNCSNFLS